MNERLRQFIDYLGISTRAFEQKISVSNGLIARFLTKNTTIQSNILSKICDTFPALNPDWFITGNGEMLRSSTTEVQSNPNFSTLLQRVEDLARENGQLKAENEMLKKEIAHLERVASAAPATAASA